MLVYSKRSSDGLVLRRSVGGALWRTTEVDDDKKSTVISSYFVLLPIIVYCVQYHLACICIVSKTTHAVFVLCPF